jgi:ABC-type lipoprotein export system ATPase subunit
MRTAAIFGIDLDAPPAAGAVAHPDLHEIAASIRPGRILHLTGPSGFGKSTLLRGLAGALGARGATIIDAQRMPPSDRTCVDCFPGPLGRALAEIAGAGLAEARCFLRTPAELSDGERFRLRLALALRRAHALDPAPVVLVIDEFAATLDRPTARGVARLLRRGINNSSNAAAITATSHDDLDAALAPDRWLRLSTNTIEQRKPRRDTERSRRIVLEEGDAGDYRALSRWHYRRGDPAAPVRTLRLRHTALGETIGVLVVAMPTLNTPFRRHAWPGRYNTGDKRADARRINAEIRRIARVIIDPRFRGLGLARRLVRAYLHDPLTPCTEAAAVMGAISDFFIRAGMTAYRTPPGARTARLLDAIGRCEIPAHLLASPDQSWEAIDGSSPIGARLVERELRIWAGASRSSARHSRDALPDLWRRACRSIAGVPVGYAHTRHH